MTEDSSSGDFIIDADGDDDLTLPEHVPTVPVKIGGRTYTAHCPKDVMWAQLASGQHHRSVSGQAYQVFSFLDAAFESNDVDDMERRFRDRGDPLSFRHLMRALDMITEHFRDRMQSEFDALGLQLEQDLNSSGDGGGNRRERRARAAQSR